MFLLLTFIRTYWLVITLFTLAAITALSLWPLESLPAVPGNDKTHHFIAYAVLMFPVVLRKYNYWPLIGVLFFSWSGAIELVQPYVNRYGEWLDMIANTTGLIGGLLVALLLNRFFPANSEGTEDVRHK